MKKIAKYLFNKSLLFIDTLVSVLSVFLFSSFSNKRKLKFIPVKGVEKCLILTNGVSLKRVLDSGEVDFSECDIFTVNLFYETNYFFDLRPTNHVITDNAFWDKTNDSRLLGIQKRFKEQLLKVTWDLNLFVPFHGANPIKQILQENKNIKIVSYNMTPVSGIKKIAHILYLLNLGMPKASNVLNATIFLALNSGYKSIHIYGADHSWIQDLFVDEDNDVCCFENHFYDNTRKPYKLPKESLADGLRSIVEAFDSYKLLKDYSKSINSKILNKTKGSFIDVFDKE